MTKRERVLAAVARQPVDRPPVAFWRHVPDVDHTAEGLAAAMLDFHRRWDLDLIKVMSSGVYCVEDWRCTAGLPGHAINWHDRLTAPSLADAKRRRPHGALVGGLGEGTTLRRGPVTAIVEQVRDAIRQAEGVGVIVGPGCVLPLDVPNAHLAAVVDTASFR